VEYAREYAVMSLSSPPPASISGDAMGPVDTHRGEHRVPLDDDDAGGRLTARRCEKRLACVGVEGERDRAAAQCGLDRRDRRRPRAEVFERR
jgi:hypothetical protein